MATAARCDILSVMRRAWLVTGVILLLSAACSGANSTTLACARVDELMNRYPDAVAAGGRTLRSLGEDFSRAVPAGSDIGARLRLIGRWLTTMDDIGDPFATV